MKSFADKYFNKLFWLSCGVVFVVVCLRALLIPFSHDETATFFFYIQSDNFLPYKAHVYTNNHFLNSTLGNLCYHLAGSHRFVLRIPNLIAFIFLCLGIYRHFKHLNTYASKILLTTFFILTFNFLDFFEVCRGYGLSMGFMLFGLSFLTDYFRTGRLKALVIFSIFLQLALAANLILVVALTILLVYVFVFQFYKKLFFSVPNLLLQIVNTSLLIFWIKFSFFYKEQGSLDYGVGNDYWEVTFKTLITLIYGVNDLWLQIIVLISFTALFLFTIYYLLKRFSFEKFFEPKIFYSLVLILLIIAFYLQKKILDVNFPEDRTGLFFFLLFGLSFVFFINEFKPASKVVSIVVTLPLLVQFLCSFNLSNFTSFYYHTMPKALYDQLKNEFEKKKQIFTIGGHRVREMNYTFLNYRGQSVLNAMDESEEMQMNCDYYFAMKREQPFYKEFYEEIGYDEKWERVLLKRKEKITHSPVLEFSNKSFKGEGEFSEFIRIKDTTFASHNPLELYLSIQFKSVPAPFNAFIVLQIQDEKDNMIWYKRVPLNWLSKDLNGQEKHLKITTGNLPAKTTIVAYLWNIDKQNAEVMLNSIQLYQLNGKGVDYRIPAEFYLMNYQITKKPLL